LTPAAYCEFSGFDSQNRPTEETYFRRLHFGAFQVVMEYIAKVDCLPWAPPYSAALLKAYQYFTWLHWELVPYRHSYDWNAYETNQPIFREPDPNAFTAKLGEELFVAYLTAPGVMTMKVALPAGRWIDYWDTSWVFDGPTTIDQPAPLGREPVFLRAGGIIPLQVARPYTGHGTRASAGSLRSWCSPTATRVSATATTSSAAGSCSDHRRRLWD
jgi:alpha-glucosidase (family GH31 glycosyl hydrolase)